MKLMLATPIFDAVAETLGVPEGISPAGVTGERVMRADAATVKPVARHAFADPARTVTPKKVAKRKAVKK